MKSIVFSLAILLIIGLGTAIIVLVSDANKEYMAQWAAERNYQIIETEKPIFRHGPFWTCGDGQTIYKVTLRDRYEKEYIVWFRLPKGLGQDAWVWDNNKHPN